MRVGVYCVISYILLFVGLAQAQFFDLEKLKIKAKQPEEAQSQIQPSGSSFSTTAAKSGIKLFLPSGWQVVRDESNSLDAQGPNGMWLAIVMNDYGSGFPTEASLAAYKDTAIKEKGQGVLVNWQERVIDNVKGIQRVEAPMPSPDDPRRITWIGYKGTIGINIVASSRSGDFDSNYSSLNALLDCIKWIGYCQV